MAGIRARLADRNSLPPVVNAAIDHVADHPNGVLGRLAARRFGRPDPDHPTAVSSWPDLPTRMLIAPVNYSGQAREWGRAIERRDASISTRNMAIEVPGGFSFESDLLVPLAVYNNDRDWQQQQFDVVAGRATHVLIEAEEPPFGRLLGRSTERQARALLERGVDVAFMAHGTDIRLPSRHVGLTPWSLYTDPAVYIPRLELVASRNAAMLERMSRPVFVSTPDLLADVPSARWCPVVVDSPRWASPDRQVGELDRPLRVAHAPSISVHKGTPLITPLLERLAREGVIDYRVITGVPSALMPDEYRWADVVLDQFRAGAYGVAACEAMAAGCVVVGHVLDAVRDTVLELGGTRLPIVEATPDTLDDVLRTLAGDRAYADAVSQEGIAFVKRVHDGRLSAAVLVESWLAPSNP